MRMAYYFAYGSNLDREQMARRGCRIIGKPFKGLLKGSTLAFNTSSIGQKGGVADVVEGKGEVPGIVWNVEDIAPMDKHEGCRFNNEAASKYYRHLMDVDTEKGLIKCWVYKVTKPEQEYVQPSFFYIAKFLRGYREIGFEEAYSERLLEMIGLTDSYRVLEFIRNKPQRVSMHEIGENFGFDRARAAVTELQRSGFIMRDSRDNGPDLDATFYTVPRMRDYIGEIIGEQGTEVPPEDRE